MKKILTTGLLTLLFAFCVQTGEVFAQKYGHLNSGNLLAKMPEAEAAQKELDTYQEQLAKTLEAKVATFRAKAQKFVEEAQSGKIAQVEIQKQQTALQAEEQALAKEEQGLYEKVQNKRAELLGPILEKVDTAIKSVGKDNGYTMIFDTSIMNTILFAKDADDVMALVSAKLGI